MYVTMYVSIYVYITNTYNIELRMFSRVTETRVK